MTSETEETVLAEALAMTGLKTPAELIDMANVGQSLMERIADLIKQDGPFKGWMPADDPAEIVFDLVNHYEDAALSRAPEALELGSSTRMTSPASRSQTPLSAGWQEIESNPPPHNKAVLLGWRVSRDGRWISEVAAYSTGERFDNGYSNLSLHGSATHWMPLPPPPTDAERERIEFEFLENPPEADYDD